MRLIAPPRVMTGLFVTGSVLVIDQVSKMTAAHAGTGMVAPARNPAYAFGSVAASAPVLIIGAIVVLGLFLVVADRLVARFGVPVILPALVAGGTIGNTLDRVRLGSVRDFLVVPGAIINLADVAVAAGLVGLVITLAMRAPKLRTQLSPAAR